MATDFGKLDFSVSFNPTSAFPLDSRSYFESLTAAQLAAATAKQAGSKDSAYYYGQTIVVVEDNVATLYIIQSNNTLMPFGKKITFDSTQFEYDQNENLGLKGFSAANKKSILTKGENGTVVWIPQIETYSKDQIDTKIAEAITSTSHLKRKIVKSIAEIEIYVDSHPDAKDYIFMIPTGLENDSNKFNEYIVVAFIDEDGVETQIIEQVGSWEVDLQDYAKKTDVETALNNKVDKKEGYTLLSPEDQKKLAALELDGDDIIVPGGIEADNVKNLDKWIEENSSVVKGLSENNLTNELFNKLQKSLSLNDIETSQLKIDDKGKLSIIALDKNLVVGLNEALNERALKTEVNSIANVLNSLSQSVQEDISDLRDKLTWKNI